MTDTRYDVLFAGELKPGTDPFAARARLQALFKLSDQAADQLFSGRTIAIKRDLEFAKAVKFRDAFSQAGALVQLLAKEPEPVAEPETAQAPGSSPAAAAAGGLTLLPARTGGPLEIVEEGPPPDIDISQLSLVGGYDWSLEDCTEPPPPLPEPDISHLTLAELEPRAPRDEDQEPAF